MCRVTYPAPRMADARRISFSCITHLPTLCRPAEAGAGGGQASAAAAAAAARSLAALREDGAMRPLVESLLEGHWAPGRGRGPLLITLRTGCLETCCQSALQIAVFGHAA